MKLCKVPSVSGIQTTDVLPCNLEITSCWLLIPTCSLSGMAVSWDKLSSMVGNVHSRSPNALEQLLEEVSFQRRKERRKHLTNGILVKYLYLTLIINHKNNFFLIEPEYILLHGTPYWTDLFVRHFLFEPDQSIDADDLLFFVRKKPIKGSTRFLMKFEVRNRAFF